MITAQQLDILRDMLSQCDDEWLLSSLSLRDAGDRNFVIEVGNANWQDYNELFPS